MFDDATSKFETASYVLPKAVRERGDQARTEVETCSRCHGEDARPVFDSYPLWPGFYGSVKDSFLEGPELAKFRHYQASTAKTGVYRFLLPPKGSVVSPFMAPENLIAGAIEANPAQFKFMPNTRLGMALTELNRKRLFRKLRESSLYMDNEKRLLAKLLECRSENESDTSLIRAQLQSENADRIDRLHFSAGSAIARDLEMQELKFVPALGQIVEMSRTLGLSMTDWSMSFLPSSYAFYDGILSGISEGRSFYLKEDFIYEMLKRLARDDARFFSFFKVNYGFADYDYPFGHRLDLVTARRACSLLTSDSAGDRLAK